MAKRWDKAEFDKAVRTPQGFLRVPVYATRTGVFKYTSKDGTVRRELRLPEEVFKQESMDTLGGIPLTRRHPNDMVNSHNAKLHMEGFTADSIEKAEEKYLKTYVTITDEALIADVEAKKIKEVSCGYNCDLEETAGVWNGEAYDCIQRNIVYNHLAAVERGRAGSEVRFRLDADDALGEGLKQGAKMGKIKIGDQEFECSPELQAAFEAEESSEKSAQDSAAAEALKAKEAEAAQMDAMKVEKEKLATANEGLQAKVDALEVEKNKKLDAADVEKTVTERVKTRLKVISIGKEVLPSETKFDELTDRAIKEAIIKKDSPNADLGAKSDTYIDARFDSIAETIEEKKAKLAGSKTATTKNDSVPSAEEAKKRQNERTMNGWKNTEEKK